MSTDVKIAAVCSSPRRAGHTEKLLGRFIKAARAHGAHVKQIELYKLPSPRPVSGKLGEKLTRLSPFHKALVEADGFIIATPTYWFNIPGILKNFIDHLTVLEESEFLLEGKVAGFIVYSPQGGETSVLENLALTFNHMGALLPPYGMIFYRGPEDRWAYRDITLLAKNMVQQIRAQKALSLNWDYPKSRYRVSPVELFRKRRLNKR